jgi:hypothetical protein
LGWVAINLVRCSGLLDKESSNHARPADEPFLGSHLTDCAGSHAFVAVVLLRVLTDTAISCMLLKHYIVHVGLLAILEGRLAVLAEPAESSD